MQPEPAVGLVATRLAAAVSGDATLAALLDARQRAVFPSLAVTAGLGPGVVVAPAAGGIDIR
jgi:hypothetical protein